jgi:hypothetical protein
LVVEVELLTTTVEITQLVVLTITWPLVLVVELLVVAVTLLATGLLTANTVGAAAVWELLDKVMTAELVVVSGIQVLEVELVDQDVLTRLQVV